jgi:hypothetical protein
MYKQRSQSFSSASRSGSSIHSSNVSRTSCGSNEQDPAEDRDRHDQTNVRSRVHPLPMHSPSHDGDPHNPHPHDDHLERHPNKQHLTSNKVQYPLYHDYANITIDEMNVQRQKQQQSPSRKGKMKNRDDSCTTGESEKVPSSSVSLSPSLRTKTFPVSVHEILTFVDHHPEQYYFATIQQSICPGDIIRWEYHGRSFVIYNRTLLTQCLLPMFLPYQNEFAS